MKNYLVFTGIICALAVQTGCKSEAKVKEEVVTYVATVPLRTDTAFSKDYVCQIQAIRHIELRTQEKGFLQKIFIDEGQHVKQGQLLFQILPSVYDAEVQTAEAEKQFAEIEYQTTKRLADSNIVSTSELAMAKAKLDKAKAELGLKKVHRGFTQIRAPYDGIIDRLLVRQGSLLDEGELLTNLSDNSKMWVYFNVPEAEYLDYQIQKKPGNEKVGLVLANHALFSETGVVETIEADFDSETGNIPFRATFSNPTGLLRHGETGNIRMVVPLQQALIIPQKATFEVLDKKYVFVIDKDSTVRSREISIGADMEDLFVVTQGLQENEHILLEGLRKVKDGDRIRFTTKDPATVISTLKVHAE